MPGSSSVSPSLKLLTGIKFVRNTLAVISSPRVSSTYSEGWLPDCTYWKFLTGYSSHISIPSITIKDLRQSWRKDSTFIYDQPSPPLKIPIRLLLRPFFWRNFWSLPMTAKAFTPWWRILQDCVGSKAKTYKLNPVAFQSPICTLCDLNYPEDLYHLIVGCDLKWKYWIDVFQLLDLKNWFPDKLSVWTAMTCLSSTTSPSRSKKMKPMPTDILVMIGTAFSVLWKYH